MGMWQKKPGPTGRKIRPPAVGGGKTARCRAANESNKRRERGGTTPPGQTQPTRGGAKKQPAPDRPPQKNPQTNGGKTTATGLAATLEASDSSPSLALRSSINDGETAATGLAATPEASELASLAGASLLSKHATTAPTLSMLRPTMRQWRSTQRTRPSWLPA